VGTITVRDGRRRLLPLAAFLTAGLGLLAGSVLATPRAYAQQTGPRALFTYADSRIVESSGLASSWLHQGIVYTHNDTEAGARVFAVDRDGKTKAVLTLRGVEPRDWEGIAVGKTEDGKPAVFVGDIGDNFDGAWPEIWVYRFPEPKTLENQTVTATRFRFRYDDGPRNAEGLLVDPRENRIYVVSKEARDGGIYLAPPMHELSTTNVNVLRRIAPAPPTVTDGAFSRDGRRVVLRDYISAYMYDSPDGDRLARIRLPLQRQGEAVTFARDGRSLLVGSEGANSEVWQVPLPTSALPKPAASGAAAESNGGSDGGSGSEESSPWGVGGNLLALVASGAMFYGLYRVAKSGRKPK
jgi:hypothetical protein